MLCSAFGGQNQTSFYAIQNASLSTSASVSIDFYNTSGQLIANMPSTPLSAGGKISVNPCNEGVASGTSGSAVIKGASGDSLIAVGKVKSNDGYETAFLGEGAGSTKSAASYIRWAGNSTVDFRSFVAIMNISQTPASNVHVKYYNAAGTLVVDHDLTPGSTTLGSFIKTNSNPSSAGALDGNGEFGTPQSSAGTGGAIEITSDQPIVVVVRMARDVTFTGVSRFSEDYNAKPVP
jgi:hypothetical protein